MIQFTYKNHRGEIALRTVEPTALQWLKEPGFGYEPGWFIVGLDTDRGEQRIFSLDSIVFNREGGDDETLSITFPWR